MLLEKIFQIGLLNLDPEFILPANSENRLSLKLTKQNILGQKVENVLDNAKYIEIRYKRILLDNDVVLTKRELYPELKNVYGSFSIDAILIDDDSLLEIGDKEYNFLLSSYSNDSHAYSKTKETVQGMWGSEKKDREFNYLGDFAKIFDSEYVLYIKVTNIAENFIEKNWTTNYKPVFTLIDSDNNQYINIALLYEPQNLKGIALGYAPLYPKSSAILILIYDKIKDSEPEWIQLYINGEPYVERFYVK